MDGCCKKKNKLAWYFFKRRIFDWDIQRKIILMAFKRHLQKRPLDETQLIESHLKIDDSLTLQKIMWFSLDTLYGTYIPKDISDCLLRLDSLLADTTRQRIKNSKEDELGSFSFFPLKLWIRNRWYLWSGSRLSYYFNNMGILHPDSMSAVILISYYRYLNHQDIRFDELMAKTKEEELQYRLQLEKSRRR